MIENSVSWVLVLLSFVLGGTFCYRIYLSIRLASEQKDETNSSSNLKRIRKLRKKNQETNVQILLWTGIGMVVVNLVIMYLFIGYQNNVFKIEKENVKLKESIQQLKVEQTQWIQASGFKVYPEEGIEIDKEVWNQLNSEEDSRKVLGEIEQSLSSQLQPYIGLNTILVTNEESKDSLKLTVRSEDNKKLKDQLSKTVEGIVKNLGDIETIKEVEFQFVGDKDKVSTSYLYLREKADQPLEIHENVSTKAKE